jgi:hypothetical protein
MKINNLLNRLRNFVKDQGGMEALQTVCIIAIAALVMVSAAKIATMGREMADTNYGAFVKQAGNGGGETTAAASASSKAEELAKQLE